MAVFTGTPVVIRSTSPWFWIHDYGSVSEFAYGGARYVCGITQSFESPVVGKSTDGISWTVFIGSETGFSAAFLEMVLDEANDRIVWVGRKSSQLATFVFDLIGETFSSATLLGSNVTSDNMAVIRPNGTILAFYSPAGVAPRPIRYVTATGSGFGSPVLFASAAVALTISGLGVGSDGTVHVFYRSSAALFYNTLSPSDVIGTPATADATNNPLLGNVLVDEDFDQIIVQAVFEGTNYAVIGEPIASPSWSKVTLHALADGLSDNEGCVVKDSGTVKFLLQRADFSARSEIAQINWDGSAMGTPDVWWDLVANRTPGTESVDPGDLFTDGITALSQGGRLSVVVTAVIDLAGEMSNVYTFVGSSFSGYRNRAY